MKLFSQVGICMLLIFSFFITASAHTNRFSWYCERNTEHKQPRYDPKLSFMEKYDAYYVDDKHDDNCEEKVIYLTFDAGYENGNIEKILDVLKRQDVKGAFFILSNLVLKNPDLVRRMADEGHTVGNHTSKHRDMSVCSSKEEFATELGKLEMLYTECTGKTIAKFFRPPEGRFSESTLRFAHELGYRTVFWSFAYDDWNNEKQMSPEKAKEKIYENLHNGAVLLLHPTSKTNADILEEVIIELRSQGYSFGSLEELTA